jgi:hypothetical protein
LICIEFFSYDSTPSRSDAQADNAHALFDQLREMTDRLDRLHQEHRAELKRPWWRRLIGRW